MVTSSDIQYPRLKGEKQFQKFCLKLAQAYWKDGYAQLHGRRGQRQHGVDITGSDYRNSYKHAGMQCKGAETDDPRQLTENELVNEVEEAKGHPTKLDIFIVAYAGKKDEQLQNKAAALSDANEKAGLFKVFLWSWDDIVEIAGEFPDVINELNIENRFVKVGVLDPKRPEALNPIALEAAIATYQSLLPKDADQGSKSDPVAEGKIDLLRDQIRAGKGSSVVEPLRDFIHSLEEGASPHIRFRAHTNLGAALIQEGQFDKAIINFDEAAAAEPGTAASHAYKALAALLREKPGVAHSEAEKALKLDPSQQLAAKCLIEASPAECQPQQSSNVYRR
jgi:tetratricopeptide (TPR) repeat protein